MSCEQAYSDRTVLIVDDEPLVVRLLEMYLGELGVGHVIKCPSLSNLMDCFEQGGFDLAILDISLCGRTSYPAAERLRALKIPFFFVSGLSPQRVPPAFQDVPFLAKPYSREDVGSLINLGFASADRASAAQANAQCGAPH